ncbi:Nonribosomal peptide synthase sidE [Colletotrichum sidae]|uniref:Nonribosomal peptide synthase sidE n=1 Tax=Colletotrichum sidae TaxID=1347389 RepID=A0A4R8TAK7_9PEZI|nr:Nonribosomal peptide synthase sidE [Colletotrichum sidae]
MSASAVLKPSAGALGAPSDLFSCVPAREDDWRGARLLKGGDSTLDFTVEATQIQKDICREPTQWAMAEMPLPEPLPSSQTIADAWHALATYHACLRAHLHVAPQTGDLFVRVLRRIEHIVSSAPVDAAAADDALAHMVWQPGQDDDGSCRVILRFRRALVDATSIDIIKTDFLLMLSGLPPLDRMGFVLYANFIKRTKKPDESAAFWDEMLATAATSSALSTPLPPGGHAEAAFKERRHLELEPSTALLRLLHVVPTGTTRQALFETIWALILSHHSGSEDVMFGVVGRDDSFVGAEFAVGCLDQTFLVRVKTSPQSPLGVVARAVEACATRAAQHAYIGLAAMLRHLPGGQTVESVLNYTSGRNLSCLAPGLRSFPIVMSVSDSDRPMLAMSYVGHVDDGDAATILHHYHTALVDALSRSNVSESPLGELRLVSDAETALLLAPPPAAAVENPPTPSQLIERSVLSHPSRAAVIFEDEACLSYRDLNRAANRLARLLGLAKGQVVPLLMDRSANLCVAILALLKSGVAYAVLNPEMPQARNARVVQECAPSLILADKRYAHMFPSARSIEDVLAEATAAAASSSDPDNVVVVDDDDDNWNAERKPSPDDASYIIYTSGSTGKPKGAIVTNRAVANGIMQHPSLEEMPRVLLFYSPTASAAQRTLISTLVHGGTIVLASKRSIFTDLAGVVNKYQVDAMEITPTALSVLRPSSIPSIKQITLAGENVPQALVDTWAADPGLVVRNRFGTSECTQLSLGRRLRPKDNSRNLGVPTDTTQAYVLRPGSDELAPLSVPGELCLSGPQLASGYLHEPGLTDRAFVRNPFRVDSSSSSSMYAKMYRTGDGARRLPDGSIEILGRIDWQVKINGNKVEPVDVDHAIARHESVAACSTFGAEVDGNVVLVVAVVPRRGDGDGDGDGKQRPWGQLLPLLRRHAIAALPPYMVPTLWMPLDELPRIANGKVDLKTLRGRAAELGVAGFSALATASATRRGGVITDPVEHDIAAAWAAALGIPDEAVDRHQSFVELGGSSLQAIRVIASLRDDHGIVVDFGGLLTDMPLCQVASLAREASSSPSSTAGRASSSSLAPFVLVRHDAALVDELKQSMAAVDAYPATPLQAALLATLNTDDDPYVSRRVWDVGGLDVEKLRRSFSAVFELSDILRTGFVPRGHSLVQCVRADVHLPWIESRLPLDEYTARDSETDLPLSGPLFRVGLVRDQWLVVTMHHALFDSWSHGFLYQDVAAVYLDQTVSASPRPRFASYVDFLQRQDAASAQTFWADYLAGAPKSQLTHVRPGDFGLRAETVSVDMAFDLHDRARSLGVAAGAVVSAAWAVVLSRHQNSHDVVFATTLSGRDAAVPGIESMDGPALVTVPQRVAVDPESSLINLAKNVCTSNLVAMTRHAHVGMQGALKAAGLPADCFDTLVNMLPEQQVPEATAQVFKRHGEPPLWKTPYTLVEVIAGGGRNTVVRLSGEMEPMRLRFLCDSLIKAVTAILETPQQPLAHVDVIGDAEQGFLRDTLSNRDTLQDAAPQLLQADFERCARACPGRVAIDWQGAVQVSYARLDGRANHVAGVLVRHGLGPGDCVAMMLDKSVEAVVSILAILKAGCTYVPLSPDNPAERNAFICRETSARLIILHQATRSSAPDVPGLESLLVDEILPLEATAPPVVNLTPRHHAYIIYTSGSTGRPKGIKVPHQAVAAAVKSMCAAEGRSGSWSTSGSGEEEEEDEWRVLQMSNYVFDVSIMDVFNTLSTGGSLCMAPTADLLSDLAGHIRAMRVRQVALTTTVAGLLRPSEVPGLQMLVLAGEAVTRGVLDQWTPHCRVLNSYGPTETSIIVCTKEVEVEDSVVKGPAGNIGPPYPTVMAFVLDTEGSSLRHYGSVGELCVAGPQLADGYVGRDDLTAQAFVWNEALQVRLYRTGDLVRWLPGGQLECLGRKDTQVKMHGFRIELGEIEAVIRDSGLVTDVVVVLATVGGKQQLVAACLFKSSTGPERRSPRQDADAIEAADDHLEDLRVLRQRLGSLAHYMVPKIVLPMTHFPLMPSHKVDRRTLQATVEKLGPVGLSSYVVETASDEKVVVVPTQTPLEKALERMWADVLDVPADHMGREANFLSLGGDSVSAISLASAARQMGYSLAVPDILMVPKLKELAARMAVIPRDDDDDDDDDDARRSKPVFEVPYVARIEAVAAGLDWEKDVEYAYPCPPGQTEFLKQGSRREQAWVLQTVRRMPAAADQDVWIASTSALVAANDILRTTWLQVSETDWVGLVLRSCRLDLTRLRCETEAEAASFAESAWNERFVFGRPFIRYNIITYPDGSWDLVTKMDHAVYDGTLLRIFDDHYAAILGKQPLPVHTAFRDFASHMFARDKSKSLAYWRERLHGWGESCLLDRSAWATASAPLCNSVVKRPLPKADVDQLAGRLGVTPAIVFQGAFQMWLSRATARREVAFDYLLTGRNVDLPRPQTINGTTANFLPMRIGIDAQEPLASFLQRTQRDFWAMTDHGDIGLDRIYEAAGLDRQRAGNRVLFIYQPFDPAPQDDPKADFRWLIMARCKVRMPAPYALVVEVHKAAGKAFALKVSYDNTVLNEEAAGATADEIVSTIQKVVGQGESAMELSS